MTEATDASEGAHDYTDVNSPRAVSNLHAVKEELIVPVAAQDANTARVVEGLDGAVQLH